jgi:hypothetical protein
LKARIVAERIEHWIEPEECGSVRHTAIDEATDWHREQLLQSCDGAVAVARLRGYASSYIERPRTRDRVFLNWIVWRNHLYMILDSERYLQGALGNYFASDFGKGVEA